MSSWLCFNFIQQQKPSLESSASGRHFGSNECGFFLVDGLASERVGIDQFVGGTIDESRLSVHTADDRLLIVVVARIWPVAIALVFGWTLEAKQRFRAAANLVGPIATLDAIVVEEACRLAQTPTGHSPSAFRIINTACLMLRLGEESKLIRTARSALGFSCLCANLLIVFRFIIERTHECCVLGNRRSSSRRTCQSRAQFGRTTNHWDSIRD